MRTVLLLATAAACAWWANPAEAQQTRTERRVVVVQPQHGGAEDSEVYESRDDRAMNERDYRGRGRWVEGEWTPDRRRFEGVYEVDERGRGHDDDRRGASYDGPRGDYDGPPQRGYNEGRWSDEDMMRQCRGGGGAAGAGIGGVVGGVVGNRVAGRGNRTAGTLAGAAAGAVAGAVIERSIDSRACREWQRDYDSRSRYSQGGRYEDDSYGRYDDGYGYGGMQTIVIPGQPVIIEETETTYETVVVQQARPRVRHRVAPRRAVHRPRPRPRCVCR
jgi:hypothetical protein